MEEGLLVWFYSCSDQRVAVYLIVAILLPLSAYALVSKGLSSKNAAAFGLWPKGLVSAGVLAMILEWSALGAIPLLVGSAAVAYDPLLLISPAAFLAGILGAIRLLLPECPYGKNDFLFEVGWFIGFCATAILFCAWIRGGGRLIWAAAIQTAAICWLGRNFLMELYPAPAAAPPQGSAKPLHKP